MVQLMNLIRDGGGKMMTRSKIFTLFFIGLLTSCQQLKPDSKQYIDPFPVVPTFQQFSKQPILSKEGDVYTVTDEFMIRATQEHGFVEKVIDWRNLNEIK
jgi:hypothetical protein